MGVLSWVTISVVVVFALRFVPYGRAARRRGELLIGVAGGTVAGFCATALDFGGLDEVDVRAILFAAFSAALWLGLRRFFVVVRNKGPQPQH